MRKNFKLAFIIAFVYGVDLSSIPLNTEWIVYQNQPVKVESIQYNGFPICRAQKVLKHDVLAIAKVIQDVDNYPSIFKRVTRTIKLESDVVQVILDMPFPFSGRDYIIKYDIINEGDTWLFSFKAVEHEDGELIPNYIRLPNAAGSWRLETKSKDETLVTYTWNGELLGNFPDFALQKAWVTQGTEVLLWLNESLAYD